MLLSYKYRLRPSTTQAAALEEQLQLCRWTYNKLLNHCYEERKAGRGTPTQFSLQNLLPDIKAQVLELDQVFEPGASERGEEGEVGIRILLGNRRRVGLRTHLPRFRGADKYSSLTYPQMGFELKGDALRLSRIGS